MSNLFQTLDLSKLSVVILLTIVPSILLLMLILYSDRKSREPILMILICVFSGIFTICFSLIVDKTLIKAHLIAGDLLTDINSYSVYRIVMLAGVEEEQKQIELLLKKDKNGNLAKVVDKSANEITKVVKPNKKSDS